MKRSIVHIDSEKCNGCGLCAQACHEGAIAMVEGKAVLTGDEICDGLGDCLPACPAGAITIIEREAAPYDRAAVAAAQAAQSPRPGACPSARAQALRPAPPAPGGRRPSQLGNWPVQLQLVPTRAPYLDGADLLIAADCTAFACAGLHEKFLSGRITLIGCPKLDQADYAGKLAALFAQNDIRSLTVLRMEVPCCGGLVAAVRRALALSGRDISLAVQVISTSGEML